VKWRVPMLTQWLAKTLPITLTLLTDTEVRAHMHNIRHQSLWVTIAGICWLTAASAQAPAPAAPSPTPAAATAVCKEAVVSPVSGFAECVDPRGAPVAPAPKRPDAARDTPER